MIIRIGYVPYLNMVPFYERFGPEPVEHEGRRFEFWQRTPRALGLEAQSGLIDAAPLSLVDSLRVESQYEPIANFGVGVRQRRAQSVLLFSKVAMPFLSNAMVAVTDDTSTSVLLLQLLLEQRYGLSGLRYGRIASLTLFDGDADALLLIGDEAIRARRDGVRGFPAVADLGEEWFQWQRSPFVFARWMVRRALAPDVKEFLEYSIEKSLSSNEAARDRSAYREASRLGMDPGFIQGYWGGFAYRLTSDHLRSMEQFDALHKHQCLNA